MRTKYILLRPHRKRSVFTGLRFGVVAGTDAGGTHFDTFYGAVIIDPDILKIDFESAFDIFHDVHTDTAGFFRQTFAGDASAVAAGFTADRANFAHCIASYR